MPHTTPSGRNGRTKRERGAAAVEFALVVPLLLTIVFGIVEFGWAFGQMLDVRHGARETARIVSVNYFPDGLTADDLTAAEQSEEIVKAACERMDLTNDAKVTLGLETSGEVSAGATAIVQVSTDLETITGWFDSIIGDRELTSTLQVRLEQEAQWAEVTDVTCASVMTP